MRTEKRKARLDKGDSGDFIGFAAYATPTTAASASNRNNDNNISSTTTTTPSLRWSPVYLGNDSHLALLLSRIGQKRDGATKAKALQELQLYLQNNNNNTSSSSSKRNVIDALAHVVFLFHSKLVYDSLASVRAEVISCLGVAAQRVPKAWKTLLTQHPDVWGMIYCAQADPAMEVRISAERVIQQQNNKNRHHNDIATTATVVAATTMDEDGDDNEDNLLARGIWDYVLRILSYGRPKSMHDALFAKKNESSSGDLSESEQDVLEERFERIVGTSLSGLELYMQQQQPESNPSTMYLPTREQVYILWKTLSSPKPSLRRRTYSLLATCCRQVPSLVYGNDASLSPQLVPPLFTAEKDAANFPTLFEMCLMYLAGAKKQPETEATAAAAAAAATTMHAILDPLVKHMSKVLKKACLGATASKWGPTLLPLLSLFPSEEHRLLLLSSTWKGVDQFALTTSDKLALWTTVTECATFLLLQQQHHQQQQQQQQHDNDNNTTTTSTTPVDAYPKQVATLWINALSAYFTSDNTSMTSSATQGAETILLESLARDISKFHVSCRVQEPHKVIHVVSEWFWTQGIPPVMIAAATSTNGMGPLTRLLNTISQQPSNMIAATVTATATTTAADNPWQAVLLSLFSTVISQYQGSSAAVPSLQAYALAEAILRNCHAYGCSPFDGNSEERSKFIMNDLLRWLVLHTSTVSLQRHERFAEQCFHLLRMCLLSWSLGEQESILESFFRELIAAKCDTELLAKGINILLKDIPAEAILCPPLEDFLIRLGQEVVAEGDGDTHQDQLSPDEEVEEHMAEEAHRKAFSLLETVAGLGVGQRVLRAWIEAACPSRSVEESCLRELHANPLLETLVLLSRSDGSLSKENATTVLLECWRRGQELWSGQCFRLLIEDESLCSSVLVQASLELKAVLNELCSSGNEWIDHELLMATSVWSERAVRLLDLCADVKSTHSKLPIPSLKVIGLGDYEFWETSSDNQGHTINELVRFLCLMKTLVAFDDVSERYQIVRDSNEETNAMVVQILLALSASEDGIHFESPHISRCGQFLTVLGGSTLDKKNLEDLFGAVVTRLVIELKAGRAATKKISGGVAVLSLLASHLLESSKSSSIGDASDKLDDSAIEVGDEVWYLSSVDDEINREKATVVQVHSDDFPNLYYTINWTSGDTKVERQTVAGRLRRRDFPHNPQIQGEVEKLEDRLREQVYQRLVKAFVKVDSPDESVSELINVLNSQIGWGKRLGLGSVHFEVLSLLRSMEQRVTSLLAEPTKKQDQIISFLNSLSFAMGLGASTPSFPRSFELLRLNPEASIREIDRYCDGDVKVKNIKLDRATLRWLTVSIECESITEVRRSVGSVIFTLSSQIIGIEPHQSAFGDECLFVLKAILSATRSIADKGNLDLAVSDIRCIQSLFSRFALGWKESVNSEPVFTRDGLYRGRTPPRWSQYLSPLLYLLEDKRDWLRLVGSGICNDLISALFDHTKQGIAMRMLDAVFTQTEPLYDEAEATMDGNAKRKVQAWKDAMADEEADDLGEDIGIFNSWVPKQLVEEVISWSEHVETAEDDELAIGRMLCWLCLLRLTESAASKDVRNRLAFSSLFDKCAAVSVVLNLSLRYVGFRNDRKAKVTQVIKLDDLVRSNQPYDVSRMAELVLFRTVEVLPTMSKRWFEEECPKQLTQSISDFVTTHVAPETFRRELGRIKSASVFGEMAVTGSLATRQVTATYTQDDFNLRVIVELPPSFPFRSAEVDCSKTLGIPEKRWRQWGLQIRLMLNSQDGTLQDALMLWKENVDKEFTGVEPCPVCYSVLSVKKHELPNTECKTCHNRFHSTCLKQWFLSSGKSQCVLCQQPWSGIRTQ